MTPAELKAIQERADRGYQCQPINPNLNTLTCAKCKRTWWFDRRTDWSQLCSAAMSDAARTDVPALAGALEEAWKQLSDEKAHAERYRLSSNEYHKVLKRTLERLDEHKEQLATALQNYASAVEGRAKFRVEVKRLREQLAEARTALEKIRDEQGKHQPALMRATATKAIDAINAGKPKSQPQPPGHDFGACRDGRDPELCAACDAINAKEPTA